MRMRIVKQIRAGALLIGVSFASGLIARDNACAGEFVLVSEEAAPPPVCYLKTDNRRAPELLTAGNLAKYLQRISGKAFTATPVEQAPDGRAILIGKICGNLPEDPGGDGFMISITDEQIRIAGATPRGTAIGVYASNCNYGCFLIGVGVGIGIAIDKNPENSTPIPIPTPTPNGAFGQN